MWSVLYVFPGGRVGVGLLLLRLGVAGSGLALGNLAGTENGLMSAASVTIALALAAGLRTRTISALGAIILPIFALDAAPLANIALHGTGSLALAFIGPGAFSIDSRLYGRRRIVLPDGGDGLD